MHTHTAAEFQQAGVSRIEQDLCKSVRAHHGGRISDPPARNDVLWSGAPYKEANQLDLSELTSGCHKYTWSSGHNC